MASSGNFCTWNPLGAHGGGTTDFGTLSGGNLLCTLGDTVFGNFGVTSGKWYWEWCMTGSAWDGGPGWANQQVNTQAELGYNSPSSATGAQIVYMYCSNGSTNWHIISDAPKSASSGTTVDYSTALAQDDIIGICADFDNDKWYMSINGSFTNMRSGQNPADGSNPLCSASGGGGTVTIARTAGYVWYPAIGNWAAASRPSTVNFGQDSTFGGEITAGGNADGNGFGDFKYAPPTGFLALCTGNLSVSDDIDPAQTDNDYPGKQFNAITYTGNGSTNAITGLGFKPDLVWVKRRNSSGDHRLVDSSRGVGVALRSNVTGADVSESNGVTAFGTDGFTLGSEGGYNASSDTFIGWCWRANGGTTASNSDGDITSTVQANTKAGFSICTYTANGSANQTWGHGLSAKPDLIMVKKRSATSTWTVYHSSLGATKFLYLSSTASVYTGSEMWNDTEPTSSLVTVDNNGNTNSPNGATFLGYVWHSVEGYSKFGSYVGAGGGNSATDNTFVYTGFRPRFLFVKNTGAASSWIVYDTARNTSNPTIIGSAWNETGAEFNTSNYAIDILSNGFKFRTGNATVNTTDTWIYGAWGDVPFKYNNTF